MMVVFKMRENVTSASYSSVYNVLRQWSISLIPTYTHCRPVAKGGSGGSIEPPILGSVCCACANMLPLLIATNRTYTLGASAAAQPCLTVELAEFPQIIKLAMSLGQGKAYLHTSVLSPRYARLCRRGAASSATLLYM